MRSTALYAKLEMDFITSDMSDDWAEHMTPLNEYLSDNFKHRSMGLVCDFSKEINQVFSAVFPTKEVMQNILDRDVQNAMLFVHHPEIWDIRKAPNVFQHMDSGLLEQFKEKNISIYNLHVPLDNYGEYSTSISLAKALAIKPKKAFAPYFGAMAGVLGETSLTNVHDLRKKFQSTLGHDVSLFEYGDPEINNGTVALVAGGGLTETIEEIAKLNTNVMVTGITAKNEHSKKAHEIAEKNKINLLGGTHYSTEKFACIAMVEYFKKCCLPCEFIAGEPVMEDM